MRTRKSSAIPAFIPASVVRSTLGDAMGRIRSEEGLTWVELAELIGKGDDQTTRYVDASATMDVTTFYRAKQLWNGRFTGDADKLVSDAAEPISPRRTQSCVTKLAFELAAALEDGEMTRAELLGMKTTLQNAQDAIAAQLAELAPKAVSK